MRDMHEITPEVVMTPGRGHEGLEASGDTIARAVAASDYYDNFPRKDVTYLFSGYYAGVASRGHMEAPPAHLAEAVLAEKFFRQRIGWIDEFDAVFGDNPLPRPEPRTVIESESVDTFTNFTCSIEGSHLEIGKYTPDSPLALALGEQHGWRTSVIASQALALPEGSLWRLPTNEGGTISSARERLLLAVTRLALADIGETGAAEPGNLSHTKEAARAFEEFTLHPLKAVSEAIKHPELWRTPEIPVVRYPVVRQY